MTRRRLQLFRLLGPAFALATGLAYAEDAIDRKGTTTALRGDVTAISRTEVVLTGRTNKKEYRIPVPEIDRIRWDGEKPQVSQVRIEERNGLLDKAIEGYQAALKDADSANLRTDLEFLIARATATKALGDAEAYDGPIKKLEDFRTKHPTHFRYFETLKLLTRLYMAKNDVEKVNATIKLMSEAPWNDFKMDTEITQARVSLAHDDVAAALAALERVISVKASTPAELSRRYEALLAKASCLEKQGKFTEAASVLRNILDEAAEEDIKTLAEASVRLGDCFQAGGRLKEAIIAYLRVDILFPKDKAHHAEALYQLSQLFAKDGKPDKAADAATRLQQTYPRSPWTAKLTVAPK
jgi:tetratricopeptide (TPR) repeat protein